MKDIDSIPERMADRLAERIERRRFLRKSTRTMFVVAAAIAAGEGFQVMKAPAAFACDCNDSGCSNGSGCPTGGIYGLHPCGPSPCCSSLRSSCNCGSGCQCKNNASSGGNCKGHGFGVYSSGCWSCSVVISGFRYITSCCDCEVKAACNTPFGRCISWCLAKVPA